MKQTVTLERPKQGRVPHPENFLLFNGVLPCNFIQTTVNLRVPRMGDAPSAAGPSFSVDASEVRARALSPAWAALQFLPPEHGANPMEP